MAQVEDRIPPGKRHFTTGEAATLCSVTPNTVYKWIRTGRLPAQRTPGGHHRISRGVLLSLLRANGIGKTESMDQESFAYCWDFNSKNGAIPKGCLECIVYRSRTRRCYEMSQLPEETGYRGLFCQSSCEECEYYHLVHGQRSNVLVITDQERVQSSLKRLRKNLKYNLEITDCEYRCSMLVDRFRPDYVVIDCSLGADRSREFAKLLNEDPRIPLVRVILVGKRQQLPAECDRLVFALIEQQLTASTLEKLVMI